MPGDENTAGSGGEFPSEDDLHVDITLPDGSKLAETHGGEGAPVKSHLEGRDPSSSHSSDSDDADRGKSVEPPRRSEGHGFLAGNSRREREEEGETEVLDSIQSDLSKNPAKVPIAFAGATVLAIGLIFGVSNWDRGDDGKVATDVSRPVTDEVGAEEADPTSGVDNKAEGGLSEVEPAGPAESLAPAVADWSTADATDDWEMWFDFDRIISDRTADGFNAGEAKAAVDLTSFAASSSDGNTVLTLGFGGDAQAVQAFARGSVNGWIVIRLSDGTRLEVTYDDDGSFKVISPPPGVSVTGEWLSPDTLRLTLSGVEVDVGSTMETAVVLEIFDGAEIDTVTLETAG